MNRYFIMRNYDMRSTSALWVYVLRETSPGDVWARRFVDGGTAFAGSTQMIDVHWYPCTPATQAAFEDPDTWVEVSEAALILAHAIAWSQSPGDILQVEGVRNQITKYPLPHQKRIKTSNTKHKVGVPKNKLP